MKKVALLNNTINQYHHGCELVVKQINQFLEQRNIQVYANSYEGEDWETDRDFLGRASFCNAIIVNGEGTIHHGRKNGKKLLEVSKFAKSRGIPCFLINATYEDNPKNYKELLAGFEDIFVRDSSSLKELLDIGINSQVVPDLTVSHKANINIKRSGVGVTDSSMTPVAESLYEFTCNNGFKFLPVIRSHKHDGTTRYKESLRKIKFKLRVNLDKALRKNGYLNERRYFIRSSIDDYLQAIASCSYLVSGRFHSDCFCLLTETPFLAIDGNSHKVRAMISDIGLNKDRVITPSDLANLDPGQDYSFSEEEKIRVRNYLEEGRLSIVKCFDEIAAKIN